MSDGLYNMKLHVEDNYVTSNSKSNSAGFTIAASAKAFQILSSGIYQRKIEAIVRELSCNAYDSHVQAGHPDLPFSITLPTDFEPEFVVEDFGVGLSADEVENIYTTYFASTKTNSNDVIGALGLGSKTPFAYTDTFTIRARKDGIESFYNAHINAAGSPAVTRLAMTPTDEPNGVRVSVPVRRSDFDQFYRDATKVYSWFKIRPEFSGRAPLISTSITEIRDKLMTDGYVSVEGNNHVVVVMGNVAYDINNIVELFGEGELPKDVKTFLKNRLMYIAFNIGDLDVQASRETISFGEQSKINFVERLRVIIDTELGAVQSKIHEFSSVLEQLKFVRKSFLGDWASTLFKTNDAKYISEYTDSCALESIDTVVGKYAYDAEFAERYPVLNEDGTQAFDSYGQPIVRTKYNWPESIQLYYSDCIARTSKRSTSVAKVDVNARVRRLVGDVTLSDLAGEYRMPNVVFYYCDNADLPPHSYRAMLDHSHSFSNLLIAIHVRNPVLGAEFRSIADMIGYDNVHNVDLKMITESRNAEIKEMQRQAAAERKVARALAKPAEVARAANTEFRGAVVFADGRRIGNYSSTSGSSNLIDAKQFAGMKVILVSSIRGSHQEEWNSERNVDRILRYAPEYCYMLKVDAVIVVKLNQYQKAKKLLGAAVIDTTNLQDRIDDELAINIETSLNQKSRGSANFSHASIYSDVEKLVKPTYIIDSTTTDFYRELMKDLFRTALSSYPDLAASYAIGNDNDDGDSYGKVDYATQTAYQDLTYKIRSAISDKVKERLTERRSKIVEILTPRVKAYLSTYPKMPVMTSRSSIVNYIRKIDALKFNKLTSVVEL